MAKADKAQVTWDAQKKGWLVRIQIGEEVIRRPAAKTARDAAEDALRSLAVQIARDDGYELDPSKVAITR